VPVLSELAGRLEPPQIVVLIICAAACFCDLRTRRIPNALTFGAAAIAFVYAAAVDGVAGLGMSAAGWATGLVIFLPVYFLRGLGAGDVKFLACLGAWLGPSLALRSGLYAAIAGGAMALIVAFASGYLRTAVDNLYLLVTHFRVAGVRPHPELTLEGGKGPRLPYALPIAAGTVVAMWLN
jgi:prepilin peptidase CpaA